MAATGYTPILIYASGTAAAAPSTSNLTTSATTGAELALNYTDGKLYYKDAPSGSIQVLATKGTGSIGGSNTQVQFNNNGVLGGSSGLTWDGSFLTTSSIKNSALTSGRVTYAGASGLLSDSANLTYNGTNLNISYADAAYNAGLTVTNTTNNIASQTKIYVLNSAGNYLSIGRNSVALGSQSTIFSTGNFPLDFYTDSTQRMTITGTGSVGIGTSSPSQLLHVASTTNAQGLFATSGAGGGSNRSSIILQGPSNTWYINTNGSDLNGSDGALGFYGNSATRMVIDSSGNLGLGVTPSAWGTSGAVFKAIEIGLAGSGLLGLSSPAIPEVEVLINAYYNSGWKYAVSGYPSLRASLGGDVSGAFTWNQAPSGTAGGAISFTRAMTLDASGQLGIGTSSPSVKLHVSGTGAVSSRTYATDATGDASFFVGNNDSKLAGPLVYGSTKTAYGALGSNETAFYSNASTTIMADGASAVLKFAAGGNTERMRIDSSGNVGIGTSSPSTTLDVAGTITSTINGTVNNKYISLTDTASGGKEWAFYNRNGGTAGLFAIRNVTDGVTALNIDSSGNLGLGVTPSAWNTSNNRAIQILNGYASFSSNNSQGTCDVSNNCYNSTTQATAGWKYTNSYFATLYQQLNGTHAWYNAPSGTAGNAITFTQAMTLDASGRLAVGTTTPDARIDSEVSSGAGYRAYKTTTGGFNAFNFYTANENVIGTIGVSSTADTFYLGYGTTPVVTWKNTGIVSMPAYGAGAATFSASGVISSVSDETWKTKDGVPTNTDAMLQKLEPGYWFYNEEKAPIFGEERQLGFYAQNVHEAIGEEAAPTPQEGKPWGYHDRSVLAVAVMSLKNALNTIEELKQRIATLENK